MHRACICKILKDFNSKCFDDDDDDDDDDKDDADEDDNDDDDDDDHYGDLPLC